MKTLATKYRPQTFAEIVGQDSVKAILTQQLNTKQINNCLIFSGSSGCGKTTAARIFANSLDEGPADIIEIDAASNNGVDNVRNISSLARARSIGSTYKTFIIDEAHMLTTAAWNAFLKCLEEPPAYTVFIFCTTEPQKIPVTVKNRCMRFNFTRIPSNLIERRLNEICVSEGIINYLEVTPYLSRICNGEMRNAISLLETWLRYDPQGAGGIDAAIKAIGNFSYDEYFRLLNVLIDGNTAAILTILDDMYERGENMKLLVDSFLSFCLDITKYVTTGSIETVNIPPTLENELRDVINFHNPAQYYFYLIDKLLDTKNMLKGDIDEASTVKVMFLRMGRLV